MRIIAVLDIMGGVVVRGVAGRREEYRPITSKLTQSSLPHSIAKAIREQFEIKEFYLADLDAILGGTPAFALYSELRSVAATLWVDAGVRSVADAEALAAEGIDRIVVGLETIPGPEEVAAIVRAVGKSRVVFSLDLKKGVPIGNTTAWKHTDPWSIAHKALELGVSGMIVLDLARIGMNQGIGTEELCARLVGEAPGLEVLAGGGVRGLADLESLRWSGIHAVLLSSSLHDGQLTPRDVAEFQSGLGRHSQVAD